MRISRKMHNKLGNFQYYWKCYRITKINHPLLPLEGDTGQRSNFLWLKGYEES